MSLTNLVWVFVAFSTFGWIALFLLTKPYIDSIMRIKIDKINSEKRKVSKEIQNDKKIIQPDSLIREYSLFKMMALENLLLISKLENSIKINWWEKQS